MQYVLAPWEWVEGTFEETGDRFAQWSSPTGGASQIELRPVNNRAADPAGVGFFALFDGAPVSGTAIFLGNALTDTLSSSLKADVVARCAWLSPGDLGTSVTVLDALWDMLTVASDPAGTLGPRPLLPGRSGTLGLHLQNHSEVRAEPFTWGSHAATQKIAERLQVDYSRWNAAYSGRSQQHRKALGALVERYSPMGLTDYRDLLPVNLRQSPDHRPMKPETTYTDDFERADTNTLGPNWTVFPGTWEIGGGLAGGSLNGTTYAVYNSDLSSDDHYSVTVMGDVATFDDYGVIARCDTAGSGTFYMYVRREQNAASHALFTVVDGTQTSLGSLDFEFGSGSGETIRIECEGSTIRAIENGTQKLEITNNDLSGQLQPGMMSTDAHDVVARDSWTAADLDAGGGGVVYVEGHVFARGYRRGFERGMA